MFMQPWPQSRPQFWNRPAAKRLIHRFRKFSLVSGFTLMAVVLSQSVVFAQTETPNPHWAEIPEIIFILIGLVSASILIVESYQLMAFLLAGLVVGYILGAIALLGYHFDFLPPLSYLWPPTLMGLSLGFLLIGPWWWGYRQGYIQALLMTLSGQHKPDPVFESLIRESAVQDEKKPVMGFFKRLNDRARAIRYRRLVSRGEMNTLYTVIKRQIQQDWQDAQAAEQAELKAEKRRQVEALIAKADRFCEPSQPTSALSELPSSFL